MKEIQKIWNQYQEPLFRMALYHLIEKGKEHFDDETVAAAKADIREKDAAMTAEGKIPVMTVAFQDAITDCAAALSVHSITDILRFVKHFLHFAGDEKLTVRCKNCGKELSEDDGVPVNSGYEDAFHECDICHEYSMEDGSVILCEGCGSYYTPDHEKEDGDDSCPYCSD